MRGRRYDENDAVEALDRLFGQKKRLRLTADGGTGGGGDGPSAGIAVEEGGATVVGTARVLDFDAGDFDVADAGSGTATVALSPSSPSAYPGAEAIQDLVAALLVAGSGATLTYDDVANTLTIAATGGGGSYTDEMARDAIGAALVAGANVTITVNDPADTITIAVSGLTSASLSDFAEAVQDVVGAMVGGGTYLAATYSDPAGTETIDLNVEALQDALATWLVAGTGVSIAYNDAAGTYTIAATGGVAGTLVVQDEGTPLTTSADTLNFVGGGVVASGAGATKTITIPAASSIITLTPGVTSGRAYNYASFFGANALPTSQALTANRMYLVPFPVPFGVAWDAFMFRVTALVAASVARVGYYLPGSNGQPTGAAVLDLGTIDTSTVAIKTQTTTAFTPTTPWIWLALLPSAAISTYRSSSDVVGVAGSSDIANNQNGAAAWTQDVAPGWSALPTIGTLAEDRRLTYLHLRAA